MTAFLAQKEDHASAGRPFITKVRTFLSKVLYPAGLKCLLCGAELSVPISPAFCPDCATSLKPSVGMLCVHCGEPIDKGTVCKNCAIVIPNFDRVISCYQYDSAIGRLIVGAKDGGKSHLAYVFADAMAKAYRDAPARDGVMPADFVTYVPWDKKTEVERGNNSNRLTAEAFSKNVELPLIKALVRVKKASDSAKTGATRIERLNQIADCFAVNPALGKADDGRVETLSGKHVILIDDVVTTGATAGECARILKNDLGVERVTVVAFAR